MEDNSHTQISNSLDLEVKRHCKVSEPFLHGILSEISNKIFRVGIPDFPHEEINRLKEYLKNDKL